MPIRIDALDAGLASRNHVVPAMDGGATVKLTVGQILDLLIDGAPETLDTLTEIATALANDENLAATLTAAIALKADAEDTSIELLTTKSTPIGPDALRIYDSVETFGEPYKKLAFADLQSWILSIFNALGPAPVYACRAWVNFNGTGTVAIRASGNVSSITDNGTGDYTVNLTTAIQDANYVTAASLNASSVNSTVTVGNSPTINACRVFTATAGALADNANVHVALFR